MRFSILRALLRHPDMEVRQRVVNALPEEVPEDDLEELCALTREAGSAGLLAIQVLGGLAPSERAERCLSGLVASDVWVT